MEDDLTFFARRPRRNFRARYATADEAAAAGVTHGRAAVAYVSRQAAMIGIPPIIVTPQQPKSEERLASLRDTRLAYIYHWHVQRIAAEHARRVAAAEAKAAAARKRVLNHSR